MYRSALIAVTICCAVGVCKADETKRAFFEKKIRPVLVEHCYSCHAADAEDVEAGLLVDSAAGLLTGGDSGSAVVPWKPAESLLLSAMRYNDLQMPPDQQLSDAIVDDFEKWIRDGAVDPREPTTAATQDAGIDFEQGRQFWAFKQPKLSAKLTSPQYTSVDGPARIDALVELKLNEHSIPPNQAADRRTLIRRLSLDLIGLPPTREQVEHFVSDDSPRAYEQLVDRLIASVDYGPKWARMWLDVMRYAEDQAHIVGNNKSLFFPDAWRYRDWLIEALNADMPYDRFIQLQLAADHIAPDSASDLPALGFIGLGPKYYRRNSPEVMAEEWEDRIDVVSRGLLGITAACARCHDHKYDPISTEDYYALAGVFASTELFNKSLASPKEASVGQTDNSDAVKKSTAKASKAKKDSAPQHALHIVRDGKVQNVAVMIRGKVDSRGDVIPRGFIEVLSADSRLQFTDGSGRKELAGAIASPQNPLTARVIVNRIWAQYFGTGLVATPSNFGSLGAEPSHPELLDDLAVRFMQNGWSLKWLHRQIVLSRTYKRSSRLSPEATSLDPANVWLWRVPRRRLSIEAWRDSVLQVSGRLSTDIGGPSIAPDDPAETRRTIYAKVSRFKLNPMLARFDFPDPNVHAARRVETNTPLQKLFLLNNEFTLSAASQLAQQASACSDSSQDQIIKLFHRTLLRPPSPLEMATVADLVEHQPDGLKQLAQSLLVSNEFWYVD
ncbi:MAG: PSD1 and planctomycete cytochrome C domain-containing protein [Aureliella sp.]